MSVVELIRRWLHHVLPCGLHRVRPLWFLSSRIQMGHRRSAVDDRRSARAFSRAAMQRTNRDGGVSCDAVSTVRQRDDQSGLHPTTRDHTDRKRLASVRHDLPSSAHHHDERPTFTNRQGPHAVALQNMVPGTVAATVVRPERNSGSQETNGGIAIVTNESLRARAIQNPLANVGAHALAVRSKQRAQTQKSGQNPLGGNSRLQRY